ncbi:glycosyltransferase [Fibrobacterota bacterium]
MSDSPKVSIIIPVYNQRGFTDLCLKYVRRHSPEGFFECMVVDNGSTDSTPDVLGALGAPFMSVRNDENLGFAHACNQGANQCRGEYFLFLNNDTAPHANWLTELVRSIEEHPDRAMAGSQLLFPDHNIQHAGVVFDFSHTPYHLYTDCPKSLEGANKEREFNAVTGACMMVRREVFLEQGGFDTRYENCLEDIDFCLKVRQSGKKIVYSPKSVLTHFEARSEGRRQMEAKAKELFLSIWEDKIEQDDLDFLVPDGMRIKIPPGKAFEFITETEQDVLMSQKKSSGLLHLKAGRIKEALPIYTELFMEFPYDSGVLEAMGDISGRAGDKEQGGFFYGMALKIAPDNMVLAQKMENLNAAQ